MSGERSATGQTSRAGFQAGARKTLPRSPAALWRQVVSPAGQRLLGGGDAALAARSAGVTTFVPGSHYRRRIPERPGGESLLQVRVLPASAGRATLALHRERLAGAKERAAALAALREALRGFEELARRPRTGSPGAARP